MKILMLGWELPPRISGGLGTACAGILNSLALHPELEVSFVLPCLYGGEVAHQARLLALGSHADFHAGVARPGAYDSALRTPARAYLERVQAQRVQIGSFDLIHAHDWMTFGAALHLQAVSGKKLVLHLHSIEHDRSTADPDPEICRIERAALQASDHVIAVSAYTRQSIIETYQIAPEKISVLYNVVQLPPAAPPCVRQASPVVSFIGRMTAQKGPENFLEAAFEIMARRPEVRFVMAGDGDQLPLIKSLVRAQGAEDRFSFPGFVSQEGVQQVLAASSVYVMPSLSEPFGIGAIEAVNAHVPVVASQHCGFTEVISQVEMVDSDDVIAMAEACLRLLDDPVGSAALAARAFAQLDRLTPAAAGAALAGVYRRLLVPEPRLLPSARFLALA